MYERSGVDQQGGYSAASDPSVSTAFCREVESLWYATATCVLRGRSKHMLIPFLVFVFGLFLVLGAFLLATQGSDAKRARLQKRLADALLHSSHTEDVEIILARNELMSEIPMVNRFPG